MEEVKNGELRLAPGAGSVSDGSVDGDFRIAVETVRLARWGADNGHGSFGASFPAEIARLGTGI
jgi:hypothetical protein